MKKAFTWMLSLALLVSFGLSVGTAPAAAATDYYVSTSGNDSNPGTLSQPFRTIQKGINTAAAGDTVYVRGGTYTAGFAVTGKNGTSGAPITVRNYADESPVVNGGGYFRINSSSYINLIGFELTGNHGVGWSWGMLSLTDSSYINVDGFHIHHNDYDNNVILENVSYSTIANSTITHGANGVLMSYGSSYNIVEGNTVAYNDLLGGDSDGIQVTSEGSSSPFSHHNIIKNNVVHDNADDGIDTWTGRYTLIVGNISYHNGYDRNGNTTSAYNGNGYKLGGIRPSTVYKGGYSLVIGNISYDNKSNGFDHNGGPNTNYLFNNSSYSNDGYGFSYWHNGENTVAYSKNNIAYSNALGNLQYLTTMMTLNQSNDYFSSNPNFVDAANANFRLSAGSGAINAGVATTTSDIHSGFTSSQPTYYVNEVSYWLNHDRDGNARPQGAAYDAGAYEYVNPNLVLNPDFESGSANWNTSWGNSSIVNNATDAHGGSYYNRTGTGEGGVYQMITTGFSVGNTLTLKGWGKVTNTAIDGTLAVECMNNANTVLASASVNFTTTAWTELTDTVVIPAGTTKLRVYTWQNGTGYYFRVDDIKLTV